MQFVLQMRLEESITFSMVMRSKAEDTTLAYHQFFIAEYFKQEFNAPSWVPFTAEQSKLSYRVTRLL
jgi:hypothetical protein